MTHDNFSTSNKLGLPLAKPSKQSILPVICGHDSLIQGFFPISVTTFDGTETTLMIDGYPLDVTTVTLPKKVDDGSGFGVQQYLAAVFPTEQKLVRPWLGFGTFVPDDDAQYMGAHHVMPTQGWKTQYFLGPLVTNLLVGMADNVFNPQTVNPPTVQNGTIRWVASLTTNPTGIDCGFFDFLWTDLFKASTQGVDPLSIEIVSNPPGGFFKSTLVPNPIVSPLGGIQFNTIRIIRLLDTPAGTYTFNYRVTDTKNQTANCQLTLTVV
jgi:hypothetical protein